MSSLFVTDVPAEAAAAHRTFDYIVYGLRLRTRSRLTIEEVAGKGAADIELLEAPDAWFDDVVSGVTLDRTDWINIHQLQDEWSYVRYEDLFEFLISPGGDRIFYRFLADVPLESFQTYALGRIFSFALVKKGHEPLHAATVVVDGKAVAFLGASAYGKSSLAACFVHGGYPLLTDDVLRLDEQGGRCIAFPGPPRLKLQPRVARLYMEDVAAGVPINKRDQVAAKRVYPLVAEQVCSIPVPLGAIYAVMGPRKVYRKQRISVSSLPAVDALVKLLSFTHNHELTGPERLSRQFEAAQRVLAKVPVRSLSYPRVLSCLPDVKAAILADLRNYADPI